MFCCCGKSGNGKLPKRKKELRDSLIRGEGTDTDTDPSIYDTITLDSTYVIDHLAQTPKKPKKAKKPKKDEGKVEIGILPEGPVL